MAILGIAHSFHRKITKCLWDIGPQKRRDLVALIKEEHSSSHQGKLSTERTSQSNLETLSPD